MIEKWLFISCLGVPPSPFLSPIFPNGISLRLSNRGAVLHRPFYQTQFLFLCWQDLGSPNYPHGYITYACVISQHTDTLSGRETIISSAGRLHVVFSPLPAYAGVRFLHKYTGEG